jgi:NTP pyrophosphatase (non-canonical NTP hydrolase)
MSDQKKIIAAIATERTRQDAKWGEQNHSDCRWLAILMEEVGEASKAILEGTTSEFREELVQCAAVLVSWLECDYRREEKYKTAPEVLKREMRQNMVAGA